MKKLKSILCVALLLVVGTVMFVGCGHNKNESTITLAEAKEVIVNALTLEDVQEMTTTLEDAQEGNRDLLEKLGKFSVNASESLRETMDVGHGDQFSPMLYSRVSFDGNYVYKNKDFVKYLTNIEIIEFQKGNETSKEYLNDNTLYSFYNNYETSPGEYERKKVIAQEYQDMRGFGHGDTLGQVFIQLIDCLFTDKAFESVYENEVIKTKIQDSYTLTLKLNLKGFYRLLTINSLDDDEFETYWQQGQDMIDSIPDYLNKKTKFTVDIKFDNDDNLIEAEFNGLCGYLVQAESSKSLYEKTTNIKITQYDGEITEPQWVTDYKSEVN